MVDLKVMSKSGYEEMKKRAPFKIHYGFQFSPFGKCLIGVFQDRICHISFVNEEESANLEVLRSQWPGAHFVPDSELANRVARKVFTEPECTETKVLLKGTPFEAVVWEALMRIPRGTTVSYEELARMCWRCNAVRAAANAVAKNAVSYLVPCHRVVKKNGSIHKYQWGSHIKRKILNFEKLSQHENMFIL